MTISGSPSPPAAMSPAPGDTGVLDEKIHFLEGRPCSPEEDSYYDLPTVSDESGTLYEHCVRAIKHGLQFGAHGLPLMGCGDWNDGMNLVGEHGKGESVWLAFFLYDVLMQFADIAQCRRDEAFADAMRAEAEKLRRNIEAHGWDGQWYRRAYFDNGAPLGSSSNPECQIDSIPQSWSVLSGAADPTAPRRRWTPSITNSSSATLASSNSSTRPSINPPSTPATSKDTSPASAKTAANTPTPPSGPSWPSPPRATPTAPGNCSRSSTPSTTATPRSASQQIQVEPYVVAADVYAIPRTPAAAAGPGTPAPPAGCTA